MGSRPEKSADTEFLSISPSLLVFSSMFSVVPAVISSIKVMIIPSAGVKALVKGVRIPTPILENAA